MHRVETIPLADTLNPELRAYAAAMRDGFFESPMSEEGLQIWQRHVLADGTRLRVVRDTERPFGKADEPVATFASWDGTINPGHGLAPTNFITDGCTLQTGIGAIPNAILAQLHGHRDLDGTRRVPRSDPPGRSCRNSNFVSPSQIHVTSVSSSQFRVTSRPSACGVLVHWHRLSESPRGRCAGSPGSIRRR